MTRKGKSPLIVDVAVRPTTQSYAVSKGVELGGKVGVLNLSYERVHSVSDIASPYTSYVRNAFGVRYSNSLHTKTGKTLSVDFSLNGNVGAIIPRPTRMPLRKLIPRVGTMRYGAVFHLTIC